MAKLSSSKPQYATVDDLPPELITRIVELLSGALPEIWKDQSWQTGQPLELRKKELGNCSLVCKYWAKILRPKIFGVLALNSAEDGHRFHSFVTGPTSPEFSIAKLVKKVNISYDIAAPSWFHLVFLCWQPEDGDALDPPVNVTVVNSASNPDTLQTLGPSFYRSLPRSLPPRIVHIGTLILQSLSFADFSALRQFLASVWVARAAKLVLKDINVQDIERVPTQFRGSRMLTVFVDGGNAPLRLFRSLLSADHRRKSRFQGHAILNTENALFAVMQSCPIFRQWASPWRTDVDGRGDMLESAHQHPRSFKWSFVATEDDDYDFSISHWCTKGNYINSLEIKLREDGAISSLCIVVTDCGDALSFPWSQVDEDLWALAPNAPMLEVRMPRKQGREVLVKVISRRMTHLVQAGTLKLKKGYHTYIPIVPVSVDEVEGGVDGTREA